MKQIIILILALLIALPLSAQIRKEILGKELIFKTYNKRNVEKSLRLYTITHQSYNDYVLRVSTNQKKVGELEIPFTVTDNKITNTGFLNVSALKTMGLPVSSVSGEIVYPVRVSLGEVLPKSHVNAVLGKDETTKITLTITSERRGMEGTKIDTPIGKLNGYIIDVQTTMNMKTLMMNMPALYIKTVEYFCPEIGISVKTEMYNESGEKIISRTIWEGVN